MENLQKQILDVTLKFLFKRIKKNELDSSDYFKFEIIKNVDYYKKNEIIFEKILRKNLSDQDLYFKSFVKYEIFKDDDLTKYVDSKKVESVNYRKGATAYLIYCEVMGGSDGKVFIGFDDLSPRSRKAWIECSKN